MKDELEKRIKDLREKISHIRNENKSFEMLKKLNRLISLYEDMYFDIMYLISPSKEVEYERNKIQGVARKIITCV